MAHRKSDLYWGSIKAEHTDPVNLNMQQLGLLVRWCSCQAPSLFDDLPLSEVLQIYHASIEWMTFEDWLEEEPLDAARAYNGIVSDTSAHFS